MLRVRSHFDAFAASLGRYAAGDVGVRMTRAKWIIAVTGGLGVAGAAIGALCGAATGAIVIAADGSLRAVASLHNLEIFSYTAMFGPTVGAVGRPMLGWGLMRAARRPRLSALGLPHATAEQAHRRIWRQPREPPSPGVPRRNSTTATCTCRRSISME